MYPARGDPFPLFEKAEIYPEILSNGREKSRVSVGLNPILTQLPIIELLGVLTRLAYGDGCMNRIQEG
jgi:hypothetical protein